VQGHARITRRASLTAAASTLGTSLGALSTRLRAFPAGAQQTPPSLPDPVASLLPGDSLRAFGLSGANVRDAVLERVFVTDGPTAEALRVRTDREPPLDYNVQIFAKTVAPVARGDLLFATFWLRTVAASAETAEARTALVFERASDPYTKSITMPISTGSEWRQFQVPFRAVESYSAGGAHFIFRLGYAPQTIELGGFSLVNYATSVELQSLPQTRITYAGSETGASWHAAARERIEAIRKADLAITVTDPAGRPISGAEVTVHQLRSAFGFGSAIVAQQLLAQSPDSDRYRETVTTLFNRAVMENDLKWSNWEDRFQRPRTLQAIQWLRDRGLLVRGHNLVWPSWRYLPRDLQTLQSDPVALHKRVADHIFEEVRALAGQLGDWDVVNEPHDNHDLMDILGQEVLAEWFWIAREADPQARLFLNEATTPGEGARQTTMERVAAFLLDRGAPLGGLGFQCHYGMTVPAPESLLPALERFARFGVPLQITEFDVDTADESLQADFTRDLLLAAYSHPAVDSVLMWGFWEGRHWRPDAALFRKDWTPKPNAQAWADLVTREWRTDLRVATDATGTLRTRAFLGDYELTASAPGFSAGRTATTPLTLGRDGAVVAIQLP
jgi:endo-1,4-beta-xylanase